MTTTVPVARPRPVARSLRGVVRRWPAAAGLALAAFVASDLSFGADLAPILAASGIVYLGAAALGRAASAWPLFLGTFAVITAAEILAGVTGAGGVDGTWVLLGAAVPLAAYGLLRRRATPAHGLPLQSLAMAGFGAAAAVTVLVGGDAGAYLVAVGLLGHAAWDVWHHRTNRVVVRSLAEFCVVLDTLLAAAMIVVAITG
ncbi:hypothetical protein E1262_21090 [Jiangella aurantiaca]|uniref:Uncharacterized protein n=1 Tax=Jiangella aurantiaca TaxID=2530373 RepID=A0A4V2YRV2_9ACTN|nr:hypothetical protein [Jiangella aurantiaca]TDD66827.1 hypothetical protein E1262_21090 [Jiangella aurantiaca]